MVKRSNFFILGFLFLSGCAHSEETYMPVELIYNLSDQSVPSHYFEGPFILTEERYSKIERKTYARIECLEYLKTYPLRESNYTFNKNKYTFTCGLNLCMTFCVKTSSLDKYDVEEGYGASIHGFPDGLNEKIMQSWKEGTYRPLLEI